MSDVYLTPNAGLIHGTMLGHTIFIDDTGTLRAVNDNTGEIKEVELGYYEKGSLIISPEQIAQEEEANRKRNEYLANKKKHEIRRAQNSPLGRNFFFVLSSTQFHDLPPEVVAKLVYLCTYMGYDNNILMSTQRTALTYENLSEVLGISKTSVWRFWKYVNPTYIFEDDDGYLYINNNIFKRGYMKRKEFVQWQQCYFNGIRTLYESLDVRNHKHFGYVFQLLPYINIEHNILCWNPTQWFIDDLEAMTLEEFCSQIGYDYHNVDSLLSLYRNIRFKVNGHNERLLAIVYDGVDKKSAKIIINPHILYNGHDYKCVENYGVFYK